MKTSFIGGGMLTKRLVHTEFERKFLVDTQLTTFAEFFRILSSFGATSVSYIEQRYLIPSEGVSESRIRKESHPLSSHHEGSVRYTLTSKKSTGIPGANLEDEFVITEDRYNLFLQSPSVLDRQSDPIHKARFRIPLGSLVIEFDVFRFVPVFSGEYISPRMLSIAEIELPSMDAHVPDLPFSWEITEVTHLEQYKNRSIARRALFPNCRTESLLLQR